MGERTTGTGFYYLFDTTLYLVTAAHVLYKTNGNIITNELNTLSIELLSYDNELVETRATKIRIAFDKNTEIYKHPSKDVCIISICNLVGNVKDRLVLIPKRNVTPLSGNRNIGGFDSKSSLHIKDLIPNQDIVIIGYPTSLDQSRFGRTVYDFKFPLVQSGIISGISELLGNIIISGAAFAGNSGGAVMAKKISRSGIETLDLIGLLTEYIPNFIEFYIPNKKESKIDTVFSLSNSGYSVVVPIKFVDELILSKK
ncbi:MAG: trypsin-like peptidase domain-containing protein [Saprospiraceae bacterium]|nr:trypsin-like peptidase domain-containing protein [Saprospiraceae bacterium]